MIGHRCSLAWRTLAGVSLLGLLVGPLRAQDPPRPEDPPAMIESPAVEVAAQAPAPLELPETAADVEAETDAPLDLPALEEIPPPLDVALPAPNEAALVELQAVLAGTDPDALRRLVVTEPNALGPLSIGTPDGGLLFNPVPMPEGPLWSVRNPHDSFGTVETIGFIATAVEIVETEFPGSPRLVIGDVSRADGGRLDRHKSHQAGRDADIGFYFRTGGAGGLKPPRKGELDLARTWGLLRAFITETDIERIFVDRSVQRLLYDHARAQGDDRDWLDNLFGRQGKDALVQHERRHLDHMHVRFFNREAQEHGRLAYPLLVEAGLLPGPMVKHRAANGETLSHLARRYGTSAAVIRAANGIRGSSLRAGRSYMIPVRKIPTPGEAVVVPPRRLPPGPPLATEATSVSAFPSR